MDINKKNTLGGDANHVVQNILRKYQREAYDRMIKMPKLLMYDDMG